MTQLGSSAKCWSSLEKSELQTTLIRPCIVPHVNHPEFVRLVMDKMRERFLAGKLEQSQLKYVGCNILQQDDGILLDQTKFVVEELEDVMIAPIRASRVDKCTAWRSRGGGYLL